MNLADIIQYHLPTVDFTKDVILEYDNNRVLRIVEWNLANPPKASDIIQWTTNYIINNSVTNSDILDHLDNIDKQSIRALREPGSISTTQLSSLTSQATSVRSKLVI